MLIRHEAIFAGTMQCRCWPSADRAESRRHFGNDGPNTIAGGFGLDVLQGRGGNDSFLFDTAPNTGANRDTIKDFSNVAGNNDRLVFENAVFTRLGGAGALNENLFKLTTQIQDNNDRLLYNPATGVLLYDEDGNGPGAGIEVAVLTNKPVLTVADFSWSERRPRQKSRRTSSIKIL